MAANSSIEWTDTTWNPVVGCTMVSPGCAHCYAETMAARLKGMALADIADGRDPGRKRHYIDAIGDNGRWSGKLIPVPEALADPLGWRKPRRVFVNSMSDLFHESVPASFIADVFATMTACTPHTFQILTKRAERMCKWLTWWTQTIQEKTRRISGKSAFVVAPLPNVWLGVSCEDQQRADERIPWLLKTPAAVRFLSCEPLLGPIDLNAYLKPWRKNLECPKCRVCDSIYSRGAWECLSCGNLFHAECYGADDDNQSRGFGVNWVIVGGESGPGSRPCDLDWIGTIVHQCRDAGVACFVKQLGSVPMEPYGGWAARDKARILNHRNHRKVPDGFVGILTHDKKGGSIEEFPEELRVRQFPEAAHA